MKSTCISGMRKAGYSLVEMMVVVGIIGVTASTATFQVIRRQPMQELNRACWEVMAHLREARSLAVSRGVPAQVTVNTSTRRITTWTDDNGNGARNTGEESSLALDDRDDIRIWTFPTSGTFSPVGTFSAGSYSVMYLFVNSTALAQNRIVFIYPNGQVQLIDP